MSQVHNASHVSLNRFKRTKIIATIGPATDSYKAILGLIDSGTNGLRLNFSHGNNEERIRQIKWIRKAAKEIGKPVAIIQDLQGPKIRLGDFEGLIKLQQGQKVIFAYKADYAASGHLPTQYDLSQKVRPGERVYLFDGKVRSTVTSVKDGLVYARVENDGVIMKRKGINLPDTDFAGDVITKKDRADLIFGATQDFDYVAQSFVQTAADVQEMRKLMKGLGINAKLIVKFETKNAIEHMEEIVQATDALMVARGDLAVEALPEAVPIVQRQLVGLCKRYAKPVIIATQMLFSMTEVAEPTRAEVSDIATAVLIGADCVMLSDETAMGAYPIEAVSVMKRVIVYTEQHAPLKVSFPDYEDHSRQASISKAIINLAENVQAKAIVAETKSGDTAIHIAAQRSAIPTIAVTSDLRTAQQLAIVYDIKSYIRPAHRLAAQRLTDWLLETEVLQKGNVVVTASGQYPGVVGTTDTIKVRILE